MTSSLLHRSQNVEDAGGRSWQGTPAPEEALTRKGSTEADVPEYRASPTEDSERDFASTTRGDHFTSHPCCAIHREGGLRTCSEILGKSSTEQHMYIVAAVLTHCDLGACRSNVL